MRKSDYQLKNSDNDVSRVRDTFGDLRKSLTCDSLHVFPTSTTKHLTLLSGTTIAGHNFVIIKRELKSSTDVAISYFMFTTFDSLFFLILYIFPGKLYYKRQRGWSKHNDPFFLAFTRLIGTLIKPNYLDFGAIIAYQSEASEEPSVSYQSLLVCHRMPVRLKRTCIVSVPVPLVQVPEKSDW